MGSEQKLYKKLKSATPKIIWNRVENISVVGMPDLLGYKTNGHFFTVELKVTKSKKVAFSPHQIAFHIKHPTNTFILVATPDQSSPKLYPGSAIQELVACSSQLDACGLPLAAWSELEHVLLNYINPSWSA